MTTATTLMSPTLSLTLNTFLTTLTYTQRETLRIWKWTKRWEKYLILKYFEIQVFTWFNTHDWDLDGHLDGLEMVSHCLLHKISELKTNYCPNFHKGSY